MKRMMEEEWERGWSSADDKWVCPDHVEDYALEQLIRENATSTACSYCSREARKPIAAELDVLIERIVIGLKHEWRDADDEGVPWEGGYVGKTYDSYDVLTDAVDSPLNDGDLIADVSNAMTVTAWAQRDFFRLVPHLRLQYGWEAFGQIVKHRRRYFFSDHTPAGDFDDPDYVAPGALLNHIGEAIRDAGLLRTLAAGEAVCRVRASKSGGTFDKASAIGTAPTECLKSSGRMAPAGIPILYGAFDEETALVEARDANPKATAFSLGRFVLRRRALMVDLSAEPSVPSLFDEQLGHLRSAFIFLRFFAAAIAEPYERDDRIHIEYVPTQVVTEWIRTRFEPEQDQPVMGVIYRSARHPGGTNVAFFLDNTGSCDAAAADGNETALLVMTASRAAR